MRERGQGRPSELAGRRVTVMGLGRFGGGAGAVRFLANRGARVTLTDLRSESELAESLAALDDVRPERLVLGRHELGDFTDADLVVVNPAVRPGNQYVAAATAAGVPLTTEIALFVRHQRGHVVGVTGTNGKSTTAAMIHAVLREDGRPSRLGGNIGGSLLDEVDAIAPDDWTVLELSSFQLRNLDTIGFSPEVAVVTNFAPNHLDWHSTLEDYRASKQAILRWQTEDDVAVLNVDDPEVADWPTRAQRFLASPSACPFPLEDWLAVPGPHARSNAALASTVGTALVVGEAAIGAALRRFDGLPHRLQFVAEVGGRRFVDDSLATTPESVTAALEAFDAPVVLLAGGYDKGADLSGMAEAIRARAKAVGLMGSTGPTLATMLRDPRGGRPVPKKVGRSFPHVFDWAIEQSAPGDVVLLSPGCASYDWFRDYEDRADCFREAVAEYERLLASAATPAVTLRTA